MASQAGEYVNIRQEAYEGASEHYRLEQKGLVSGEADQLAAKELANLWARSHHAVRNNGTAATAKLKYRQNLGAVKVVWKNENGKPNKKMQKLWNEFVADPNLDGYGTLENTQDVWNGAMFESGEALTRMIIKRRKGFTVPLVLQTIESEFLDPLYDAADPDNTKNSITFKDSRPVTYHFLKKLKGTYTLGVDGQERVKVPADEVLHIFERGRPGQWRGIPKLAPILLPLYELDDLTDATVNKQKAAQAVAWIVKNTNPAAATAIGTVQSTTDSSDVDESGNPRKVSQSGSSNVQYLNKGEELSPVQGTDIGDNLDTLIKSELHKIATTCGLSYESLTGDLTGISFSSLKFVINEMKTSAEFIYSFYTINLGLRPLCNRFQELAELYAKGVSNARPSFEHPRRYSIDALKDIQAELLEIANDLVPWEESVSKRNGNVDDILESKAFRKKHDIMIEPEPQSKNTEANSNSAE